VDSFEYSLKLKIIKRTIPIIVFIMACAGIIGYMYSQSQIVKYSRNVSQVFIKWFEQLPDEHWLHKKEYQPFIQMLKIETEVNQLASLNTKMTINNIEQSGKAGEIISYFSKQKPGNNESKYQLKDSNNKKIKGLKLVKGKSVAVNFYRDSHILSFDIEENEFYSGDFLNKLAMAYMEDDKVAFMYNGVITAKTTGKTNMVICIDGKLFKYPITIR
jgi:hypothetical protein